MFRARQRSYALLRLLGTVGEYDGLHWPETCAARANVRYHRVYVRGMGGREREATKPSAMMAL